MINKNKNSINEPWHEISNNSKGSDQTAHRGFAGLTYQIVENLMHWLIFYKSVESSVSILNTQAAQKPYLF